MRKELVEGGTSGISPEKEVINEHEENLTHLKQDSVPAQSTDDISLVIETNSTGLLCNVKNDLIQPIQILNTLKRTIRIPRTRTHGVLWI